MKNLFFVVFLFFSLFIKAQDFKKVDSIVNLYPDRFSSIVEFSYKVNSDFETDIEKVRAVYYWISNHIFYDYKQLKTSRKKSYFFKNQRELEKFRRYYAENVLRKKTGICEGYSQLMKFVLKYLDIRCEVVSGYVKRNYKAIGSIPNTTSHAWNAVFINQKWHLIDATWSTGNYDNDPTALYFTDTYFMIPPEKMILNHFPKDKQWQLLKEPYPISRFISLPVFNEPYFKSGLSLQEPMKGIIRSKYDKKITLYFDKIDENKSYYYSFKEFNYSYPLEFTKTKNGYKTQIGFKSNRSSDLYIVDDEITALEFKVKLIR